MRRNFLISESRTLTKRNEISFPLDERPEVQVLYAFAQKANLYNFDPQVVHHWTNQRPSMIVLETPTHFVGEMGGKIHKINSFYDGSDERARPEVKNQWYQCAGKWTEEEAVGETFDILRRTGETALLAELLEANKYRYDNEKMRVKTPSGDTVTVTPFLRVSLYDKRGVMRVQAEYRMGTNGPVGLTMWFCLP